MKYKNLTILILLLSIILISGCKKYEEEYYFINITANGTTQSCPEDTVCFEITNALQEPFIYNISYSLDEPYIFDVSGGS